VILHKKVVMLDFLLELVVFIEIVKKMLEISFKFVVKGFCIKKL
jgi:hypothetical protein